MTSNLCNQFYSQNFGILERKSTNAMINQLDRERKKKQNAIARGIIHALHSDSSLQTFLL